VALRQQRTLASASVDRATDASDDRARKCAHWTTSVGASDAVVIEATDAGCQRLVEVTSVVHEAVWLKVLCLVLAISDNA
jgi:hypothetical protein